jgi:hypothetical protein
MPSGPRAEETRRVFLSYATDDKFAAEELTSALQAHGTDVWTAEALNQVARTPAAVAETIRRSEAFLVLVTRSSLSSQWVTDEILAASDMTDSDEVKLIAILLDDVPVPTELDPFYVLEAKTRDWSLIARHLLDPASGHRGIPAADLNEEVTAILDDAGLTWDREPLLEGVRPDLLVRSPDGRRLVLELKTIADPGAIQAVNAYEQAIRTAQAIGADSAAAIFMAVEQPENDRILSVGNLAAFVDRWARSTARSEASRPTTQAATKQVFVAMPFSVDYGDTFWVAAVGAAKANHASCVRVDEDKYTGDVTAHIRKQIQASDAIIGDLSEHRPNVLYELGFAHALGIPAVHICATPLEELPFDVRNWRTLEYTKGATTQLVEPLAELLATALAEPRSE